MARLADINFKIDWPKRMDFNGKNFTIAQHIECENIFLAHAGNGKDGWAVYAVNASDCTQVQQVSPLFHKDYGDTQTSMFQACYRAYGDDLLVMRIGREHPEECFRWPTF